VPPILLIHGTADPVVPWEGGEVLSSNGGRVLSAAATVRFWAAGAGAGPVPEAGRLPDRRDDGTRLRLETWRAPGDPAARVTSVTVEGAGHAWPGDPDPPPEWALGRITRELDAAAFIWGFFKDRTAGRAKVNREQ
jgi:polyhydroxybutyrate depolymerase